VGIGSKPAGNYKLLRKESPAGNYKLLKKDEISGNWF
jgi:hypothetical protein